MSAPLSSRGRAARASAGIRKAREEQVFVAPAPALPAPGAPAPEFSQPQACYVCKVPYVRVHHFYDGMCPDCADQVTWMRPTSLPNVSE